MRTPAEERLRELLIQPATKATIREAVSVLDQLIAEADAEEAAAREAARLDPEGWEPGCGTPGCESCEPVPISEEGGRG